MERERGKGIGVGVESLRHNAGLISVKEGEGGFLGGAVVRNLPANAGDTGSSPGPGRSHMPRSS